MASLGFASVASASESWTFQILNDIGSEFTGYSETPILNCHADVAFLASTNDGAGLFLVSEGKATPIHLTAASVDQYRYIAINDAGTVVFYYEPDSQGSPKPDLPKLLTGDGKKLTDITDGLRRQGWRGVINNYGSIAYTGSYRRGQDLISAIFIDNGQQTRPLVDRQNGIFNSFGNNGIAVNDHGVVVFDGILRDGSHGLFSVDANGLATLVDASSGIDRFLDVTINDMGDVAFFGYVRIDERTMRPGLYVLRDGKVERIGGERYKVVFGRPNLNDAGGVVFMALLEFDENAGIFVGPDPIRDRVIVPGESVAGRQVSKLYLGRNALNNAGQIVFRADFADGGQGIVLASPTAGAQIATTECPSVNKATPLLLEAQDASVWELTDAIGLSSWIESQRARFTKLLSARRYDVLVVPFQPDGDTLDAVGRTMLARRLADSLGRAGDYRVADPGLVEKALGEPARYVSPQEAVDLGRDLGVTTVILGHVGHDRHYGLHVRLDVWRDEPEMLRVNSQKQQIEWQEIQFSDTELPYQVFASYANEAAARIMGEIPREHRAQRDEIGSYALLPSSLDEFLERASTSPLDEAQHLAFLGTLFPKSIESRSRDHLFERVLLALDRVAERSPGRAVLQARALMSLNRRPAALAALGSPTSPEGRALLAYLNSDLPGLGSAVEAIQDTATRLMAEMDLQHLRYLYDRAYDPDRAEALLESYPVWGPFLLQRYVDGDPWARGSNALTKIGLDILVPGVFMTMQSYVGGRLTEATLPTEPEIAKSVIDHVEAGYDLIALESLAGRPNPIALHQTDVLELAQAIVLRNAIDSSRIERRVRGRFDVARSNLADYEGLFLNNPQYILEQSETRRYAQMDRGLTEQQIEELKNEAIELGRKGFFWSGQQNEVTLRISDSPEGWFPEASQMDDSTRDSVFYTYDFPSRFGPHPPSPNATAAEREAAAKHCMDYTLFDLSCAFFYQQTLLEQSPSRRAAAEAVLTALDDRFLGHPERTEVLIRMRRQMGEDVSEHAIYQQAIADQTSSWEPYSIIGRQLVQDNRYTEARDTYLRYPGFSDRTIADRVELSNHAYEGGSLLYWTGAWEEARPLYEISVAQATDSDASLAAASRLALLDRNWQQAMDYSLRRARRYDSAYAYRDYMALLHFQGRSEESWALFDNLNNDGMGVQIWTAAYLGHRVNGATFPDIVRWAAVRTGGNSASAEEHSTDLFVRYLLLTDIVDRLPEIDLGATIRRMDPRFASSDGSTGRVLRDPDTGDEYIELAPFARTAKAADALAAFYRGDMLRALTALEEAGSLRDLNEFLPHYTAAALALGNTARLEQYLGVALQRYGSLSPSGTSRSNRFYDRLAAALVAGHEGSHDAAIDHLTNALNDRPFTVYRTIFTYYQILETCEYLYEKTGEDVYRDLGYRLAKRFQIIQPMYPWAYAFAAKLAPTTGAKIPDVATAMLLDPASLRVSRMSQEERDLAEEWLRNSDPASGESDASRITASLQD